MPDANLPEDVNASYPGVPGEDATAAAHRGHHSLIHQIINWFTFPATPATGNVLQYNGTTYSPVALAISAITDLESRLSAAEQGTGGGGALSTVVPGAVIRILYVSGSWVYAGSTITARPSTRTDIYFELVGGDSTVADPSWMLDNDTREFTS